MLQYKFKSTDAVMNFIMNTVDFMEWEVVICKFSIPNGINMDIETRIIDANNETKFIQFKMIYPTLENFYATAKKTNHTDMNVHIKFRLPMSLKNIFDVNGEYNDFFLNIYSDSINMIGVSTSYEKTRNSGLTPISNWDTYFSQLYQSWNNKYITNKY